MASEPSAQSKQSAKTPYGTSLIKAASILEYLAEQGRPRNVTEIARDTGLSKATAFKLLETLQQIKFVEKKDAHPQYTLGLGLAKLSQASLMGIDLSAAARATVEWLNQLTGETVHLGVADGNSVVYIMKLESRQAVRMYSRVGISAPMYCTGIGKALLSCFNSEALLQYISTVELKKFTAQTIVTPDALQQEMSRIQMRGYSVDNSEHEEDVRCIAVPLCRNSRLYGALSISAPKYRMPDETLLGYLPLLQQAQQEILARFVTT